LRCDKAVDVLFGSLVKIVVKFKRC
jgi:hypothetical protein